ncbi:MAG: hypothetical protein ACRDPS_01470 [Nocardioides sp.]|uniref:hypothetical protein n=1 Tax=Nocardioides sp. TaxID=35761 RepID=UPI003D6A9265
MAKSLADLRTQRPKTLPTREIPICLDWDLTNEMVRIETELGDLRIAAAEAREKTTAKPKMGDGPDPRITEAEEKLKALLDQQRDSTGMLTVKAIHSGEWALWKDEHPVRWAGSGDDRVMNESDRQIGYGLVDSTALLSELGRWLHLWEGDEVAVEDRTAVLEAISPGDQNEICRKVILLQEGSTTLAPKSQSASSTTEDSAVS